MNKKEFLEYRDNFLWTTIEGDRFTIDEMKTGHIFNSLKMLHCQLTEIYNFPTQLLMDILVFVYEIEKRKDLPAKHKMPYQQIKMSLAVIMKDWDSYLIWKEWERSMLYIQ